MAADTSALLWSWLLVSSRVLRHVKKTVKGTKVEVHGFDQRVTATDGNVPFCVHRLCMRHNSIKFLQGP